MSITRTTTGSAGEAIPAGALASGDWLDGPRIVRVAGLMAAGTVISLAVLYLAGSGTLDALGRPLGTDFSAFWTAGHMALDGAAPAAYDWPRHLAVQQSLHGVDDFFPWSYPPVFFLVAAAVAMLPYVPALLVWQGASLAAALLVFRAILPSRRALLVAAGFPAVLICLGHGQTGFLTAALIGGGVLLLPQREALAGVMFGLACYKPQFGLLIPLALAAGGYWRAIAAAAATVAALAVLTLALWGPAVWIAFLESLPLTRSIVFETGESNFAKFQSLFAALRLWGGALPLAYAAQALVTVATVLACVMVWRSAAPMRLKGATLLAGALLSTPYVLDYDFIMLGLALALFAAHGLTAGFRPHEKTLIAVAWVMPLFARGAAQLAGLPLGLIVLAAVFACIVARALAEASSSPGPGIAAASD